MNNGGPPFKAFTFYESFWRAIQSLPEAEQASLIMKLVQYGIDGVVSSGSPIENALLSLIRPLIDRSHEKYKESLKWKEHNKAQYDARHLLSQGATNKTNGDGVENDPRAAKLALACKVSLSQLTEDAIHKRILFNKDRLARCVYCVDKADSTNEVYTKDEIIQENEYLNERLKKFTKG